MRDWRDRRTGLDFEAPQRRAAALERLAPLIAVINPEFADDLTSEEVQDTHEEVAAEDGILVAESLGPRTRNSTSVDPVASNPEDRIRALLEASEQIAPTDPQEATARLSRAEEVANGLPESDIVVEGGWTQSTYTRSKALSEIVQGHLLLERGSGELLDRADMLIDQISDPRASDNARLRVIKWLIGSDVGTDLKHRALQIKGSRARARTCWILAR